MSREGGRDPLKSHWRIQQNSVRVDEEEDEEEEADGLTTIPVGNCQART